MSVAGECGLTTGRIVTGRMTLQPYQLKTIDHSTGVYQPPERKQLVGSSDDVWDDAGLDIARWTSQYPPVRIRLSMSSPVMSSPTVSAFPFWSPFESQLDPF